MFVFRNELTHPVVLRLATLLQPESELSTLFPLLTVAIPKAGIDATGGDVSDLN